MKIFVVPLLFAACVAEPEPPDRDAPHHDWDGDDFSENEGDCDDDNHDVSPDAVEVCNDVDDDCDEAIDEDVADAPTWYIDADGDGFGNDASATQGCDSPAGDYWVSKGGDCDDTPVSGFPLNPDATWYADADGDGHGDPTRPSACEPALPTDVTTGTDCDDTDPAEKPGVIWYADSDGDGFGNAASSRACDRAAPTDVTDATDCDDADPDEKPGAAWFPDTDHDGFGAAATPTVQCTRPAGDVAPNGDDCDDEDEDEHPGAVWHPDVDDDGYGDPFGPVVACLRPPGWLQDATDCDDSLPDGALYHPLTEWFPDDDQDEHGDETAEPTVQCEAPTGTWSLLADDCDDLEEDAHAGLDEVCADSIDNDCDPATGDTDPYGSAATCAATSCVAVQTYDPDASTGLYWVNPDAGTPLQVYCEMSPTGPWTLVARVIGTSGDHGSPSAQGTLTSPTQTTAAKLSDADIARLRNPRGSSILRFQCGTSATTYFKQDKAFVANGSSIDACATSPTATDWPLASSNGLHLGVQTWQHASCAYVVYFYSSDPLGCASYVDHQSLARSSGTLWVK